MISLTIPGQPVAKQSAKYRSVKLKSGKSFVMAYTPKKIINYEVFIKELFAIKYPNFTPWEGAVLSVIVAYLTIPKSKSKKQKELMRQGKILPTVRPDEDNIKKPINDALEGLAYKNDSQIVSSRFDKYYSENPRVELTLEEI